jgi:hypothetical protein
MSTLTDSGFPNLANVASRLDPNGTLAPIANVLSKMNPFLEMIPWVEGNSPDGHQITQTVNSLPSATWRQYNAGVAATKGQTTQYMESCGRLEDESKIDEAVLQRMGGASYRQSEDAIKLEGISQQFATAFFYESTSSNPERVHGLAPRYPATSGYTSSSYVLAGTNGGSNARSIWLVKFGDRKIYGIYPKGTKAGLEKIDGGRQRVLDANSRAFWAYITTMVWRCGIAVEDYRYAVRLQWDPDDAEMAANEKGLYLKMSEAYGTIFNPEGAVWLMDRTSRNRFNSQLLANEGRPLATMQHMGRQMEQFMGLPIYLTEALAAETAIS